MDSRFSFKSRLSRKRHDLYSGGIDALGNQIGRSLVLASFET